MNRTINPIYSRNLSGNFTENGAVRRLTARNGNFTDMMEELRTVSSRTAEPKFDDKSEGDFWEQRHGTSEKIYGIAAESGGAAAYAAENGAERRYGQRGGAADGTALREELL